MINFAMIKQTKHDRLTAVNRQKKPIFNELMTAYLVTTTTTIKQNVLRRDVGAHF